MNATEPLPLPDYETRDASPRGIAGVGALLAAGIAAVLAISAWLYRSAYSGRPASIVPASRLEISFQHGPDARSGISQDWAVQDQRVREHLTSYEWIDRKAGIVRVPIERAIELVADEDGARHARKSHP